MVCRALRAVACPAQHTVTHHVALPIRDKAAVPLLLLLAHGGRAGGALHSQPSLFRNALKLEQIRVTQSQSAVRKVLPKFLNMLFTDSALVTPASKRGLGPHNLACICRVLYVSNDCLPTILIGSVDAFMAPFQASLRLSRRVLATGILAVLSLVAASCVDVLTLALRCVSMTRSMGLHGQDKHHSHALGVRTGATRISRMLLMKST